MSEQPSDPDKMIEIKEKLAAAYSDLVFQLSQIEYGEASLTCIVKNNELAFVGISRTKNFMLEKQKIAKSK